MEGREVTLVIHFSSKLRMKMLANTGPSGDPHSDAISLVIVMTIKNEVAFL